MGECESKKAEDEQGGQDMRNLWHQTQLRGKKTNICCVCSLSWSSTLCNIGDMCAEISKECLFFTLGTPGKTVQPVLFLAWPIWPNPCKKKKKSNVTSKTLGHIKIITDHPIWWKGAIAVSHYIEGTKSHVDGLMHLLIAYNYHLLPILAAVMESLCGCGHGGVDCSKEWRLCCLSLSSTISAGNIR